MTKAHKVLIYKMCRMNEEEWLNYKFSEEMIENTVKFVMEESDIEEEEAEYLNKRNSSSNDTIQKILGFKVYQILEAQKNLNIKRPTAEEELLDDPDFDEFHDYIGQVISNLEKIEADMTKFINNPKNDPEAVLQKNYFDDCKFLLDAYQALCLIKA